MDTSSRAMFDYHAMPLMYQVTMRAYGVCQDILDTDPKYWRFYPGGPFEKDEALELRSRAIATNRRLDTDRDWPYRQGFLREFRTDDPMNFFQRHPRLLTNNMRRYAIDQYYHACPAFGLFRRRGAPRNPPPRRAQDDEHAVFEDPYWAVEQQERTRAFNEIYQDFLSLLTQVDSINNRFRTIRHANLRLSVRLGWGSGEGEVYPSREARENRN
ncbi:hypothetical protein L596_005897 [Steinernema carpocapsae]|uniref:Uncharacterized protein n=1 Tax=Steinernema carpocapsae TaxID=34508 RepID=A0A4U8V0H7_STECR|nr:hypothetical protein L596_005897 [Steinernema carpocapsae]